MSNRNHINDSNAIQVEFPSIKTLINRFKKSTNYKTSVTPCSNRDKAIINKLIKLLDPINSEAIKTANNLGVSRSDILQMESANIKIASAVVAAASFPSEGGNGSPGFEFKF